jgi:hypothetical protein
MLVRRLTPTRSFAQLRLDRAIVHYARSLGLVAAIYLIGATSLIYFLALLGWGYRRHLAFDAFARTCSSLLAAAPDNHVRLTVLSRGQPRLRIRTTNARLITCSQMIETGRLGIVSVP